jgi:nicotinate phosphoribosyltransferase
MVYKLVARTNESGDWVSVAKTSASKASVGGRKNAIRRLDANGTALAEVVVLGDGPGGDEEIDPEAVRERDLLVPLITDGTIDERYIGIAGTERARAHHASVMRELPIQALRLGSGEPVIPTLFR